MDTGQETKKEATILEQSEELSKMLHDLRTRLDSRFARNPKPESEQKEVAQQTDNVLNEIMSSNNRNRDNLGDIIHIIANDVLPKIS